MYNQDWKNNNCEGHRQVLTTPEMFTMTTGGIANIIEMG
jgi:hypothetical protein